MKISKWFLFLPRNKLIFKFNYYHHSNLNCHINLNISKAIKQITKEFGNQVKTKNELLQWKNYSRSCVSFFVFVFLATVVHLNKKGQYKSNLQVLTKRFAIRLYWLSKQLIDIVNVTLEPLELLLYESPNEKRVCFTLELRYHTTCTNARLGIMWVRRYMVYQGF